MFWFSYNRITSSLRNSSSFLNLEELGGIGKLHCKNKSLEPVFFERLAAVVGFPQKHGIFKNLANFKSFSLGYPFIIYAGFNPIIFFICLSAKGEKRSFFEVENV